MNRCGRQFEEASSGPWNGSIRPTWTLRQIPPPASGCARFARYSCAARAPALRMPQGRYALGSRKMSTAEVKLSVLRDPGEDSSRPWTRRGSAEWSWPWRPSRGGTNWGNLTPSSITRRRSTASCKPPIRWSRSTFRLRKVTKAARRLPHSRVGEEGHVPYLALQRASRTWRRFLRDWPAALNHLTLAFPRRMPV